MSKKIFFAQDWENVPSEIKQTDIPSITSLYNKVEEDVEHCCLGNRAACH